jgi:DNA-binding MarR family transcriptional regulator
MANRKSSKSSASIAAAGQALRVFGSQMESHTQAIGAVAGIHPTDLNVLDLLDQHGDVTAGRLAELSGVTTGAMTGVLDRLETLGYVERRKDPLDRRKVVVRVTDDRRDTLAAMYEPMKTRLEELLSTYSTAELAAITDYAERAATIMAEEVAQLRLPPDAKDAQVSSGVTSIPSHAALSVERGLSKAKVTVGGNGSELVSGRFSRVTPLIRQIGEVVSLSYRRSVFGSMMMGAVITLHDHPTWSVDIDGGVSFAVLDLSGGKLRALRVRGGVKKVQLLLPDPVGKTRIDLLGGVAESEIVLPPGASASISVVGGASRFKVDERDLASARSVRAAIGRGLDDPDHFDIRIAGGASRVSVSADS